MRMRRLPLGRAWDALREDEIACKSAWYQPHRHQADRPLRSGACFAGFAGAFFATRRGFISPESFTFHQIRHHPGHRGAGRHGQPDGHRAGGFGLVGLPEWFREFEQYRMLAFGGAMVLIMLWRPQGLLSHREQQLSALASDKVSAP